MYVSKIIEALLQWSISLFVLSYMLIILGIDNVGRANNEYFIEHVNFGNNQCQLNHMQLIVYDSNVRTVISTIWFWMSVQVFMNSMFELRPDLRLRHLKCEGSFISNYVVGCYGLTNAISDDSGSKKGQSDLERRKGVRAVWKCSALDFVIYERCQNYQNV